MDFSLIFEDLRKQRKLTQIDFAKKLSISRSSVAQIESSNSKPSREVILRILEGFDISEDLKKKFEEYAGGNKSVLIENINSPKPALNERIPEYNEVFGRPIRN
jgi:transcriptional regulator with XRE-family HTH domain